MSKMQFKTFSLKLDSTDADGTIKGYASTFGNVDLGLDVVDKGAFKKSLKENNGVFPILADHDSTKLIGWNLKAEEDDKGLYVEGKLDLNVQNAREKYSLAKTAMELGAKMGLSIGYMTIKAEPDRANQMVRRLKEVKLFEYSIVTFPMNTEASVESIKSLVGVDKAKFILQDLVKQGYSVDDLTMALAQQAATEDDPSEISQSSLEMLIKSLKQF